MALTFNFSFDNTVGNVAGTVTGSITGLQDNASGQQATNIFLDSIPAGLGGPATPFDILTLNNTAGNFFQFFDVSGGVLTSASVGLQGNFPPQTTPNASTFVTFVLNSGALQSGTLVTNGVSFDNGLTFTGNNDGFSGTSYAAVPLPATLPLLIGGLGLIGLMRRKNRV